MRLRCPRKTAPIGRPDVETVSAMPEEEHPDSEQSAAQNEISDTGNVEPPRDEEKPEDGSKNPPQVKLTRFEKWHVALGVAAAVIAVLGLIILNRQTSIMSEQTKAIGQQITIANLANENNVVTQRAFINLQNSIQGNRMIRAGRVIGIAFRVIAENSGTTPAQDVVGIVNIKAFLPEMPSNFDFKELAESETTRSIIGPRASVGYRVSIPLDDILTVVQQKQRLYMWGWVTYRDIFPETPLRLMEFCREIINVTIDGPSPADPRSNFRWGNSVCSVPHNCYDEDCADYEERVEQSRQPVTP